MRLGTLALVSAITFVSAAAPPPACADPTDLDGLLTGISRRVNASVVSVHAIRTLPAHGTGGGEATGATTRGRCVGTGVLLADGYVATTLSVAGPGDEITLRFSDGRTSSARVAAVSPLRELVLLEPAERHTDGLPYGEPERLHAGSWVFVVGYSMNSPEPMLASGRFSSRTILSLNDSSPDTTSLLQLEANVFPGNSGAAVIDADGRFVGIVLGGLGTDGFLDPVVLSSFDEELPVTHCILAAQAPLGISFALPSSSVRDLVAAHENGDAAPTAYLGIRVEMPEGETGGVRVSDVVNGSPAAVAGVRPGDFIRGLNGEVVTDPMTLVSRVRELAPGSRADLVLTSAGASGAQRRANVVLGDYVADYRTPLVWQRLISGRTTSLVDARLRLTERLSVLDAELRQLEMLAPAEPALTGY